MATIKKAQCPFCGSTNTAWINFPLAKMPALRCRRCDGASFVNSLIAEHGEAVPTWTR